MFDAWRARAFAFAWKAEHQDEIIDDESTLFKVLRVILIMYATVLAQVLVVLIGFQMKSGLELVLRYVRRKGRRRPEKKKKKKKNKSGPGSVKTMVVLGSGGHTAEVLRVLQHLNGDKYRPRIYAVSSTDDMSAQRALKMEKDLFDEAEAEVNVIRIPRSREVGQSYLTSVVTTLYAFFASMKMVALERPDLLLCNGPGTCLPVCVSMRLLKPFGKIVFIESICRTRSLSLTGKILYYMQLVDTLFVQWPPLMRRYPRAKYAGRVF